MTIDVARARWETPGCEGRAHLNNCGAALSPAGVLETVVGHLRRESEIGGYEAEDEAAARLEGAYASLARLVGGAADEIAHVENATRAWDMAFYALPLAPGDEILTSQAEYGSNVIAFLQRARRDGARIVPVPNDAAGQLDVAALADRVGPRTRLIAVSHVPTQGGLVQPAAAIGAVARAHGLPFLLDACQSVGQMPIDVAAIGATMLSATGRKFLRGPRGTGFLWVRRDWIERLEPPFLDGRAARWSARDAFEIRPDARRFENWESYVAGRLGLGAAADYACSWGLASIERRVCALAEGLRANLRAIPGVEVHDLGERRCAIVTFSKAGRSADEVQASLAAAGINVSVSQTSWNRWDFEARGLERIVRCAPHYYNTEAELDALLEGVRRI